MENNKKIKSVFLGRKVRKYWEIKNNFYYHNKPELEECTKTLKRIKILEKEMDFEFEVDEEIYLDELERYTKIQKKSKNTDGDIVYDVTYIVSAIEDYDKKVKQEYENLLKEWNIKEEQTKMKQNKNFENEDADCFGHRGVWDITLYDKEDNFIVKIDTLQKCYLRLDENGNILISVKGSAIHNKLMKFLLLHRKFEGKCILETFFRNWDSKDFRVKLFTDKIRLQDLEISNLNKKSDDISDTYINFLIPFESELDYQLKLYEE